MKVIVWALSSLLLAGVAHANEGEDASPPSEVAASIDDVLDGNYSTFLHGPVGGQKATVFLDGGWNTASDDLDAGIKGWLPVYGRFSLVLGAGYRGVTDQWRPSLGVAVALVDRGRRDGTALDLLLQFKTEGFSEPEGELELTLRSGYRFSHAAVTLETSYGQDPEANERDGELAADASLLAGRFSFGIGGRGRKNLGGKQELIAWDVQAGPHAGVVVVPGHYVGVTAGVSALSMNDQTSSGVFGVFSYALAY